jgi:hypothetical protein
MLKRRLLAIFVGLFMGTNLVFSGSTSAHNIDPAKAREVAREYAKAIRDQSNGRYLHYSTSCRIAFPGHNHIVKCAVEYQNEKDTAAGVHLQRDD